MLRILDRIYLGAASAGSGGGSVDESRIIVKSATIPTAGQDYLGSVYMYVGETNSTYTHGYIYECVESGSTYAWERIDVQPGATRGRFLALWNCATGLAESNPPSSPYPYGVGDYYIVGTVGTTNYKPSGSSYVIGTASTTVETDDVAVNDTYYYDGTNWNLQKNTATTVDQTYDPTSINAQSGTAVAQAIAGITIPTVNNATLTITQGGVSKGTFTANAGTDVTIALDSGVNIDNTTITENASNQLQASAVMNARTGTDVLPIWQGTEQQWTNGVGTDWYNWKTDTAANTESVMTVNNTAVQFSNSENNLFLAIGNTNVNSNNKLYYSSNGTDWNTSTLPETTMWASPVYGNGMALVFKWFWNYSVDTTKYVYSTDLVNWQVGTLPIGSTYSNVSMRKSFYTGNLFVVDTNTSSYAYSTDGINWTASTLPFASHTLWYVNGKFICLEENGTRQAYSNDGVTWTTSQVALPITSSWKGLVYGNGVYVALGADNSYMYSTDNENWTTVSITSSISYSRLEYIDGFGFICLQYSTNSSTGRAYLRSIDGISIIEQFDNGLPWGFWGDGVFQNNLYSGYSTSIYKVTFSESQCYTLDTTPTTSSTVYSAPNTASALTITSVGTGTITLSDTNTYTYDASGNQTTTISIGEAHPTWLCNINGVGVKIGNTLIADYTNTATFQTTTNLVTSVSSASTDTQYPSAKLFYDTCGDIETLINAL